MMSAAIGLLTATHADGRMVRPVAQAYRVTGNCQWFVPQPQTMGAGIRRLGAGGVGGVVTSVTRASRAGTVRCSRRKSEPNRCCWPPGQSRKSS